MIKFLLIILSLAFTSKAQEQNTSILNKLFAPGPLIEGHKDLEEKDCLKCHDAGKGLSNAKCLECHKEIKPFVEQKKGFHGLTNKSCFECHSDHKGRRLDTVAIDIDNFDHNITGYKLTGKHSDLKCTECHKERRTNKAVRPTGTRYFGQAATCISCHKKDDIHRFKGEWKAKDCNACHNSESWKKVTRFDHSKDTEFKLIGKHAELKCADCHTPHTVKKDIRLKLVGKNELGIYSWPNLKGEQCLSCHTPYHGKNLSARYQNGRCDTCHNQTQWKITNFDHKVTGFALRGKHAQSKCVDCHKQSPQVKTGSQFNYKGLKSDCLSCHKDFHFFGNFKSKNLAKPNACLSCHNESDWKNTHDFNHTNDTRFVIDGKHSDLKCADCHKPEKVKPKINLQALPGKKNGIYHWDNLNKDTCVICHANPHLKTFSKKILAKKCTDCHVTEGWKIQPSRVKKDFNHDLTRFALTGRHKKIDCSACHNVNGKQIFKFTSDKEKFCIDCHSNPHKEQFHDKFSGRSCVECHNTDAFKQLKTFDHSLTAFALNGAHTKVDCNECHVPANKSVYAKKEVTWHKFQFPDLKDKSCTTCHNDFHAGQLGQKCNNCHNEQSWSKVKFDHNWDSRFTLREKHLEAKCVDCHKPMSNKTVEFGANKKIYKVIKYRPISTDCITCHRDDDKHKGNYGQACQNCHLERGWRVVKDFHKNFTLHGVHYTLECAECHKQDRQLGGMSNNCVLCHQKDDVHNGSLPNCSECHRQSFWEHSSFRHSLTSFPLRGSHRTLDCFECHSGGVYSGTSTSCTQCHRNDAPSDVTHSAILNTVECNKCHNQFVFDLGL